MRANKFLKLGFIGLFALSLSSCGGLVNGRPQGAPPLKPVNNVDINKYLGKWYEIARYPNSFEKNCLSATANYSLDKNKNEIIVINECVDKTNPSKTRTAKGKAKPLNNNNNILAVNFAPIPLPSGKGNYWVLYLDKDYQNALIGEPSGQYLWILSRNPKISDEKKQEILNIAKNQQYNTEILEFVQP